MELDAARVLAHAPPRDRLERTGVGRRARSLVALRRGTYTRARLRRGRVADVAADATLRAATVRSRRLPVAVAEEDVRWKVREHRSPYVVCVVVDNSYSVQAEKLVEKVKGVALGLLEEAATRRDRVALVAFKGGVPEATVALPPTSSVRLARERLRDVPLSGRTPLADALRRARLVLRSELRKHANAVPLLVVVTDGLPTVPLRAGGDPVADVLEQARGLRRARVATVVAEAAPPGRASCAAALAEVAGGICIPVSELAPGIVLRVLEEIA